MRRWLGWLLLWGFWGMVHALTLEITQGIVGAAPIAVADFYTTAGSDGDNQSIMGDIIRNNLRNTGRFAPLNVSELPSSAPRVGSVDVLDWLQLGVEDIVIGQVERVGSDRYKVTFELLEIYESKSIDKSNRLLHQSFDNVSGERLRALAHHMSDLIFERLTGIRGAFSTRIAYVTRIEKQGRPEYHMDVSDADGYNAKTLFTSPEPVMSPAWSKDGRRLAFVSFENFRAEVYIVDTVTGERKRVSHSKGINGAPAWSPDGRQLALVLSKDGSPHLYLLNLETQQLKQLTTGYTINTEPSWAPDGRSLLFTSNRSGKVQIYRLWLSDARIERVTYQGDYNARASFTPDGKNVVMIYRDMQNVFHIAKLNIATKAVTILTNAYLDESPSIAPNGTMVLYGTQVAGKRILGAVSLDGRVKLRLPSREGSVQEPAWSPYLS